MKLTVMLVGLVLMAVLSAKASSAEQKAPKGASISEPGLSGRSDIVWFEDFDSPAHGRHACPP